MLNEVFHQIHLKSKVAMKELQSAQSQCVGFPSPSRKCWRLFPGDESSSDGGPHGTTTATSTCGLQCFTVYKGFLTYYPIHWYYGENKPIGMLSYLRKRLNYDMYLFIYLQIEFSPDKFCKGTHCFYGIRHTVSCKLRVV